MNPTGSCMNKGDGAAGKRQLCLANELDVTTLWHGARAKLGEQDRLPHHGVQLPLGAKGASPLLLPALALALSPPPWWVCRTDQVSVPLLSSLLVFGAPQCCWAFTTPLL